MSEIGKEVLELSEKAVNDLFLECVLTRDCKATNIITNELFSKKFGFLQEPSIMSFDADQLSKHLDELVYIYSQLLDLHNDSSTVTPKSLTMSYTGKRWTKQSGILLEFLHLCKAANLISDFSPDFENSYGGPWTILLGDTYPTISPNDDNFVEWYEEYKKVKQPHILIGDLNHSFNKIES